MKTKLTALKDHLLHTDVERQECFNAAIRQAVDLLGLRNVSVATDLGTGLLRRYAIGVTAPMGRMRRLVLRFVIELIDRRLEENDLSERTEDDKLYEQELAKPVLNPFRGW